MMDVGLPHLHARRRAIRAKKTLRPKVLVSVLDRLMYVVAILSPVALVPQVWQVYSMHTVAGLSIMTWSTLAIFNVAWVVYGFVHKTPPIYISSSLLALLNALMVLGIVLYR